MKVERLRDADGSGGADMYIERGRLIIEMKRKFANTDDYYTYATASILVDIVKKLIDEPEE